MDLKQLTYFVAVVECGSFSAAARKIYLSQPALSKAIKALGDSLDVRLFDTQNNQPRLTREGELLYAQAKNILRECEATVHMIERAKREPSGTIRVVTSFKRKYLKWLTKAISAFSLQNEGVLVDLTVQSSQQVKEALTLGEADVGILVDGAAEDDRFETVTLNRGKGSDYYLLVNAADPLSGQADVSFRDLKDKPVLSLSPGCFLHDVLVDGCREYGFDPQIRMTSTQPEVLFAGVEQNLGAALIEPSALPKDLQEHLVCLPMREQQFQFSFLAMIPKNRYRSPVTERFWQFIKEQMPSQPVGGL